LHFRSASLSLCTQCVLTVRAFRPIQEDPTIVRWDTALRTSLQAAGSVVEHDTQSVEPTWIGKEFVERIEHDQLLPYDSWCAFDPHLTICTDARDRSAPHKAKGDSAGPVPHYYVNPNPGSDEWRHGHHPSRQRGAPPWHHRRNGGRGHFSSLTSASLSWRTLM
jgi:hypothetical protein